MNMLNEELFGLFGRSWIVGWRELTRICANAVYFGDMRNHAPAAPSPARMIPSVAAAIQRRRSERSKEPKSGPPANPGAAVSGDERVMGSIRPATGLGSGWFGEVL